MGSSSDTPPSFKPPPPPSVQRRPSHKPSPIKRPTSDSSSQSGLSFSVPLRPPGRDRSDPNPSRSPAAVPAARLSQVNQHSIGPFPRVQCPAPAVPAPPAPPPLPSQGREKPSPTSKQHFVMVEVHRPNAEPDVNEVRPLPQNRGKNIRTSLSAWTIILRVLPLNPRYSTEIKIQLLN